MKKAIRIVMPYLGDCKKMAKEFGVSVQTISNALNYHVTRSEQSDKIRQYAREHGGTEIKK